MRAGVAGSAFTVWMRGGDNLLIRRALETIGAGDVGALVNASPADPRRGVLEDLHELVGQHVSLVAMKSSSASSSAM